MQMANNKSRCSTFGGFSHLLIKDNEKKKILEDDRIQTNVPLSSISTTTTIIALESESNSSSSSLLSSYGSREKFLMAPPKLYFTGTATSTPLSSTDSLNSLGFDRLAALKEIKPNHPYLNENTKSTIPSPFSILEQLEQSRPTYSNTVDCYFEIQEMEECCNFPNASSQHRQRIIVSKWLFFLGFLIFPSWWIGAFYLPYPRRRATPLDFIWKRRCEKIGIIFMILVLLAALTFAILNPDTFEKKYED
ncbi:12513_t:CDS:2 [Ambispora leptoticha]|uniref:12513_t:CDS:1 n=1 Tax=Ambispora leptoticha TaxID=144679 RepID=A0A9N9C349_9GLOM|nr:12513_t:CDS:2 [Ambispora leptoticha]